MFRGPFFRTRCSSCWHRRELNRNGIKHHNYCLKPFRPYDNCSGGRQSQQSCDYTPALWAAGAVFTYTPVYIAVFILLYVVHWRLPHPVAVMKSIHTSQRTVLLYFQSASGMQLSGIPGLASLLYLIPAIGHQAGSSTSNIKLPLGGRWWVLIYDFNDFYCCTVYSVHESKNHPPPAAACGFSDIFSQTVENFKSIFLHTYYTFQSTLDYKFLFSYVKF